jgi:hypothetical protein
LADILCFETILGGEMSLPSKITGLMGLI